MIYELKVKFRRWLHYNFGGDGIHNPNKHEGVNYDALIRAPFPFIGYVGAFNYIDDSDELPPVVYDWDRK